MSDQSAPQSSPPVETPPSAAPAKGAPLTKQGWSARSTHAVTLPSGAVVKIKLPNLPMMLKTGTVPNELIDVVINQGERPPGVTPTRAQLEEYADFYAWIVSITVAEPQIRPEDVPDLPTEDTTMIVEFAQRARDMDAIYHHIGGLELVGSFRQFRQLDRSE